MYMISYPMFSKGTIPVVDSDNIANRSMKSRFPFSFLLSLLRVWCLLCSRLFTPPNAVEVALVILIRVSPLH
jgi:hypothetical protein